MKEFNINDFVNIKLTETGIAILKSRHDNLLKAYAGNEAVLNSLGEFKLPEVDENGYTKMQLAEVMEIFGSYISVWQSKLPFETTIEISEEYLKEPERGKSL